MNEDSLNEAFPDRIGLAKRKGSASLSKSKKKRGRICIELNIQHAEDQEKVSRTSFDFYSGSVPDLGDLLSRDENPDAFFRESHEDQDMNYIKFSQRREDQRQKHDLDQLSAQMMESKMKIHSRLQERWEKTIRALRNEAEGLYEQVKHKHDVELQKLNNMKARYKMEIEKKYDEEKKLIVKMANEKADHITTKYKHLAEQSRTAEFLPQVHQMRDQELLEHSKKAELAKSNNDARVSEHMLKMEQAYQKKLLLHKHNRARDKASVDNLVTKMHKKQKVIHDYIIQETLNKHEKRFLKLEENILSNASASSKKDHVQLDLSKQTSPENDSVIKNSNNLFSREKRRRKVLFDMHVPTFLTVDIHNEGLHVICTKSFESNKNDLFPSTSTMTSEDTDSRKNLENFIPWGYVARRFLHSIVCGEVPEHDLIDLKHLFSNGSQGQLKCVVTDKRVDPNDASNQRKKYMNAIKTRNNKQAAAEINLKLSKDVNEEKNAMEEFKRATLVLENCKQQLLSVRSKISIMTPNDYGNTRFDEYHSKLVLNMENAKQDASSKNERLVLARKQRIETTEEVKKIIHENEILNEIKMKKEAMSEYKGSDILCNSLLCIHKIIGSGIRSKVSSSSDTKSLSQPKRVETLLRCPRLIKQEARYAIESYNSTREFHSHMEECQDNLMRVEELLLLSLHPHSDEPLSNFPPHIQSSNSSDPKWAEPGWYLDLSVPGFCESSSSIQSYPSNSNSQYEILNKYTSVMASSVGHQLATCVPIHFLKALQENEESYNSILDPFCPAEGVLKDSYNFFLPLSSTSRTIKKK